MFFLKLLWWFHLFSSSWWVLENKFHTLLHLFTTPPLQLPHLSPYSLHSHRSHGPALLGGAVLRLIWIRFWCMDTKLVPPPAFYFLLPRPPPQLRRVMYMKLTVVDFRAVVSEASVLIWSLRTLGFDVRRWNTSEKMFLSFYCTFIFTSHPSVCVCVWESKYE